MIRSISQRLRLIRYYSASRENTLWSRAADRVLIAALLLAPPAVLVSDAGHGRLGVAMEDGGMLARRDDDSVTAMLNDPEGRIPAITGRVLGSFRLRAIEERRGWPFVTSTRERPAVIEYNLFTEPERRYDTGLAEDAPLARAIEEALARERRADLHESLGRDAPLRTNAPVRSWFFGAGVWWALLYGLGMMGLTLARFGWALFERHEATIAKRRRRRGRCEQCGYDLRGTEYSARCPECGELA